MEKGKLKPNPRLKENITLQDTYERLIKEILLASGLVNERTLEAVGDSSFELLCEVRPAEAFEKTDTGIIEVPVEDFKIVVFVVYDVEIGSVTHSTARCLVQQGDIFVDDCGCNWEGREDNPKWGTLSIWLPEGREVKFKLFVDDKMSSAVTVGDYREVFNLLSLRQWSMKERLAYLQGLKSDLGLP